MSGKQFGIAVVINGVDRITSVVGKVSRSIAKFRMGIGKGLSAASERLGIPRLTAQAGKAHAAIGRLGSRIATLGKVAAGGLAIATAGFVAMYDKVLDVGSGFRDLADQTGISTDHLQEWKFAATQSGMSAEEFTKGMQKLTISLGQAAKGEGPAKAMAALGIKLRDANGHLRTADQLFPVIANKLDKVKDPAVKAALSVEFFGKAGVKMLSMIKGGSANLDEMAARARELGIVVDHDTIAAMGDLGDATDALKDAMFGASNGILSGLLPTLAKLVRRFTDFITEHQKDIKAFFDDFGKSLPGRVDILLKVFDELDEKLSPVVKTMGKLADKFGLSNTAIAALTLVAGALVAPLVTMTIAVISATVAFGSFAVAVMANPLTWIILAIVAAVALLAYAIYEVYEHWDGIKAWFKSHVWDPLTKAFDGVCTFFTESWDSVVGFFKSSLDDVGEWFKKLGKDLGDWVPDWVKNMFSGDGGANVTINGQPAGAPMGAEQTAQDASRAQLTQTRVQVDLNNLPRGTNVQSDTRGPGQFELNQGFAWGVP